LASKAAVSHTRDRLDPDVMKKLFDRVNSPLAA
jgi:hypothetical protein